MAAGGGAEHFQLWQHRLVASQLLTAASSGKRRSVRLVQPPAGQQCQPPATCSGFGTSAAGALPAASDVAQRQ